MADTPSSADVNPYAPPQVPDPILTPDPGIGVWRDGQLLVMHKDAELPRVCIYTGERAVGAREYRLVWKCTGDLFSREKNLYLPLCRRHLRAFAWQRLQSLVGLLLSAVSLLIMLFAPLLLPVLGDLVFLYVVPPGLLLGIAGVVMWIVSYYGTNQPLILVHARGDYLWFGGLHVSFLQALPQSPFVAGPCDDRTS